MCYTHHGYPHAGAGVSAWATCHGHHADASACVTPRHGHHEGASAHATPVMVMQVQGLHTSVIVSAIMQAQRLHLSQSSFS